MLALTVLLLAGLLEGASPGHAAAGLTVVANPNDTATVTWNLSDPSALTLTNVSLTAGQAALAWQPYRSSLSGGPAFLENTSASTNMTEVPAGLQIAANTSNRVPNGNFSVAGSWAYGNSSDGGLTAAWDPSAGDALLGHASPSTQVLWNSLDVYNSYNWTRLSGGSTKDFVVQNSSGNQKQGTGMYKVYINTTSSGGGNYAGLQWVGAVNWSGRDRLLLWINKTTPGRMAFNLSALNGGQTLYTPTQNLTVDWQEVEVNLTSLGSSLSSLSQVTFRFMPVDAANYIVYLDDVRVGRNVRFAGTAMASQSFVKPDNTSASPGTAVLSFDWQRPNQTGVEFGYATVSVGGPRGVQVFSQSVNSSGGIWSHAAIDVTNLVAPAGLYTVWLNLTARANTTVAIDTQVRFDNVSLEFPGRHSGSYVSRSISVGIPVVFTNATLLLDLPPGTFANVTLFGYLPGGSWQFTWNVSGVYPLQRYAASSFHLGVSFRTGYANETPTLMSLSVSGERYAQNGSITTHPFTASAAFLHWRTFAATDEYIASPQDTSVNYYINTGSGWVSVSPGANLTGVTATTIQIRVDLMSIMGFYSPKLDALTATYDFLGPLARVLISPSNRTVVSGDTLQFTATAVDAGGHANDSVYFSWGTDCPGASVGLTGLFRAGDAATCRVTAVTVGPGRAFNASVQVTVLQTFAYGSPLYLWPSESLAAAIAVAAIVGYLVVSRRFFTIDDVFLVNRDGRLISHNTRRILADRDEDILSGMLTAINSFARDSWREENSHVRRFDIGGKKTLVERGEHVFLAAVYSGRVPRWAARDILAFVADLEAHFGEDFANWTGSPEDLQHLKVVMGRFVSRMRYSRRRVWKGIGG